MTLRSRVDEFKVTSDPEVQMVLDGLLALLDRAIMGLEFYLPVDGYENEASRTLADIRKQLGDTNG